MYTYILIKAEYSLLIEESEVTAGVVDVIEEKKYTCKDHCFEYTDQNYYYFVDLSY